MRLLRPSDKVRLTRQRWGDSAKFSATRNRPAKAGLGCAMFLIVPMFAIGGYYIGAGALHLIGGRTEQAKGVASFAVMCLLSGGGLAVALTRRYREEALYWDSVEANRDTPWALRPDWATGIVKPNSPSRVMFSMLTALVFVVGACLIATTNVDAEGTLDFGNPIVLATAAIVLGIVGFAVRTFSRYGKFRRSRLKLETLPGIVGGSLLGTVYSNRPVDVRGDVRLRLRCIRSIREDAESGESTDTFWEESQTATPERVADGSVRIPVAFALPKHLPSLRDNDGLTWYRYALVVDGDVSGVNYQGEFDVPVYRAPKRPT